MKTTLLLASLSLTSAFAAVGPDYQRPEVATPDAFRDDAWKIGAPADDSVRGEWWKIFDDAALNDLESRALAANQDLHAAAARVDQARAAAGLARSSYFPSLDLGASATRARNSETTENPLPNNPTTTYGAGLDASWEIDLFGRVRRLNESARNDAAASAATFEAVRLALTAEVATNYFSLRALDEEIRILGEAVGLRRRALELSQSQQKNGATTEFVVAQAATELATAEAESLALARRRAALQNSLAVLLGEPAPAFALSTNAVPIKNPPSIPAGLPSELLERRPDIAAAERSLAAANARIGVAKAAFFPAISLTGSAGYASAEVDSLFKSDSRQWSIGPSIYLPIFQGGRNRANLARSKAFYEESVAQFRQRVLVAFQEVQDALTAAKLLADQSSAQDRAVAAARRAGELARKRYDAGFVNYFEIIDAERTVLAAERAAAQLGAQRLTTTVALVKALGGGWNAATASAPTTAKTRSPAEKAYRFVLTLGSAPTRFGP